MKTMKRTLFLTILTVFFIPFLHAQVDAPPQDDYSSQGLQDNYPTRPGYRQTVTGQSASFYKYIVEKQTRGEPITSMEHMTIRLMIANRTWPVPPKLTDKDRYVAAWIDKHDTSTANTIVLGAQASGGKIDYDAAPPASIEAFRKYYHGLPPARRTTAAKMMLTFYTSSGFDMRSDEQRTAAAERENAAGPSTAETAKTDRDRKNATDAANAARDRDYFDAVRARENLIQRINESKQDSPANAVPSPAAAAPPAQPVEPAASPEVAGSTPPNEPTAATPPAQPAEPVASPETATIESTPDDSEDNALQPNAPDTAESADTTGEQGVANDQGESQAGETEGAPAAATAAPAEGKFDGVYRGSTDGTPITLHISGNIISVTLEKITLSGSVDADGNLSASWSGVTESIEVSNEDTSGTIDIQSQLTLTGKVNGDSASGSLSIHSTGPGGYDESRSANWLCSR